MKSNSDLRRFRKWLAENDIPPSTGYLLVQKGKIKLTKIGSASYISRADREAFLQSLQGEAV